MKAFAALILESSTDKELLTDPCHSFPCYNNATCKSRASENTFECLCTERWFGQRCDGNKSEFYYNDNIFQWYTLRTKLLHRK